MSNRVIKMPLFDLSGKTAIITGGSKGIGFGIASSFAYYGANVVLTARNPEEVKDAEEDINANYARGGRCIGVVADSGKQEDIDRTIAVTVENFGQLDILVNNAGINGASAMILDEACDDANFDRLININVKGVFLFAKAAARQMKEQGTGGKIINFASMFAFIGEKAMSVYSASKSAVLSLTKTMAAEWARYGITVNAVCPGYTITAMTADYLSDEENYKRTAKRTALRRIGEIEEIAGPTLAIACDCFSYMTGTSILLDGGQTIGA